MNQILSHIRRGGKLMKVLKYPATAGGRRSMAALAIATPLAMAFAGGLESGELAAQQESVRIEITMDEFGFSPDTVRIPAGPRVTLVFTNVGALPHEFMAGRDAKDGHFERDLFEGLHVNMTTEEMAMEGGEHGHAYGGGQGGDDHGTMLMTEVGKTAMMAFTLPESSRGVWTIGCFLPGHFEAGMRGTLIVE
jgi:uncharacterized cupredoxin-like copper-binding protein